MPAGWGLLVFLLGALASAAVSRHRTKKKIEAWWAAANRRQ